MSELTTSLALMLVFVLVCASLLQLIASKAVTFKLINIGIALLLSLIVFEYLQQIDFIPEQATTLHKSLAITLAVTAGLWTLKIRPDTCIRLHFACIVGGLIFTLLPVLLANTLAHNIYWPSPSYQSPTVQVPKVPAQNTIVLLLDELSASAAGPVIDTLQTAGLHVTTSSIDPAGKNTINVIPAIWTRSNFDQAVPCGPTQVCSGSHVLDFAKVKASSENIDIVGFYHRYCSIQGLRSCSFSPFPTPSAGTELACSFPGVNRLEFLGCGPNASDRTSFIALRDYMQKALLDAPFWHQGGIIYAHLLAPHPLMGIPIKSLGEEYKENITNGAQVVKLVAQKAKFLFGDNFKIIVFSDHPLRSENWCQDKKYLALGCKPFTAQISNQIPLIIATPSIGKQDYRNIKSNQNVYDLLFK